MPDLWIREAESIIARLTEERDTARAELAAANQALVDVTDLLDAARTERDQARAEMKQSYLRSNPDRGEVAFRIEAWPHDSGANGEHYSAGVLPAADVAQELRELAGRIVDDWAVPYCPWPSEHPLTDATGELDQAAT